MVPSGLRSVLSNMKMALAYRAGMVHLYQSWALSAQSWEGTVLPEIGSFMPDIGPFSFTGIAVWDASRFGTLGIKRSAVYVTVRSVEHECIAFIIRSHLIPIMTRFRKSRLPPPPPTYMLTYPSTLSLSKPSPTTQDEFWCMVCILRK